MSRPVFLRPAMLALTAVAAAMASRGTAQTPMGYTQFVNDPTALTATQGQGYARVTGTNNPAINYFGAPRLAQIQAQRAMRVAAPASAVRPVNTAPGTKPFTGAPQGAHLSPYLQLDNQESETSLPNYYQFVRPMVDQQQLNSSQALQDRRLQQQIRAASLQGVAAAPGGGIPTTGHSTQFQNLSGYYPGLR